MTTENAIKNAEAIVLKRETKYLTELVDEYDSLIDLRPTEAESVLAEIIDEKQRLDEVGKWDEEEEMIGSLEKKNAKSRKRF